MPLHKRRPFEPQPVPKNLKEDEQVYYLKLTNEIFRDYEDYFARVILCNSMVWACSLTGKANLTFQEALDSEKSVKKQLKGFPKPLKKALLYVATLTSRGKALDVVEDVLSYARERYFKGEEVLAVMGNLWCQSRVTNIIEPTPEEIEAYVKEQTEKGEAENNDYIKDDTWGPSPDLFHYEVVEIDEDDPEVKQPVVLEALDVKREKKALTKDLCKFLLKMAMDYDEQKRKCVVKDGVLNTYGINKLKFTDIFTGKTPVFDESLGPVKAPPKSASKESTMKSAEKTKTSPKPKGSKSESTSSLKKSGKPKEPKPKKEKPEMKLTPQELKQLENERKAKEREKVKEQKKLIADFKKLWFKPKEDLEVEDLKDLPTPDPVSFKIPTTLFGDFLMVLEFMNSYSTFLKVRDSFSSGLTLDILERALTKTEIAGPFSEILQILLRSLFRLQEGEQVEISKEEGSKVELDVDDVDEDVSVNKAIQQATSAASWAQMYQNIPLYKLSIDYSSITEVLRLHLLSSGAKHSQQSRGSCAESDDPGLFLRLEEPQILKTLTTGTVFDLTMEEKLKVLQCLVHQILAYTAVKDIMDESFEQFRLARVNFRTAVAAEKKKEAEDHLWIQKLKADKVIPDINALTAEDEPEPEEGEEAAANAKPKPIVPQLTDAQVEAALLKKDKEIARRKQDYAWKEAELLDQINKHERKLGAHPLGRDRAYRRYWVFPTLPGLFVENDDENVGTCLPSATPYIGDVNLDDVNFIKENFDKLRHADKEGSDKENSTLASPKKSSKKKSTANTTPGKKEVVRPSVFGVCTGDAESCPVHNTHELRPKWSFFWEPEHVEELINGLTPRGIREKELRQNLEEARDTLKGLIKKCPVVKLNKDKKYPESISSAPDRRPQRNAAKNQADPNLGFPTDTSIALILELHLRDLILEFEEKIFLGGLGSLKVEDRADWRTAVESRFYKAGTDSLKWGKDNDMEMPSEGRPGGRVSPYESEDGSNLAVKDLSCAILQLQQGVEFKYMQRPLIEKEDEKKKKSKQTERESAWKSVWNSTNSPLDRWQISLMKSTSFAQLFVHFYSLESSVEWSRSVLNARCRVCRRKGEAEKMLLCDTCNKGHHIYCLKPPMESLPKGDWFCVDCRPEEPLPTPSKKRRLSDDEIEIESDDEDDHDRRGTKKLKEDDDDDEATETCHECGYGGEVICCDGCPLVYHLLCLNPPKTRVPRGTWFCTECVSGKQRSKRRSDRSKKKVVKRKLKWMADSDEESEEEEEEEDEDTAVENDESNDDEGDTPKNESDEDEDRSMVKVKFGKSKKKSPPSNNPASNSRRPARRVIESDDEENSESEEEAIGRGGKRRCASEAATKISQAVKRMRSDSKENETSESSSNDSSNNSNYNARKRSVDEGDDLVDNDGPKRTRLQRMSNNNRIENGELDNVLLDKLISDVLKQKDAWPFLKPVTRAEAPDYFEIVKYPMDLGKIKYKLNSMVYTCNEEFFSDLLLVFSNCFLYNDQSNHIYQVGRKLKDYCERKCQKLGINFSDPVPSS